MEQQTADGIYTELNSIKETLEKLQQDVERLTLLISGEREPVKHSWRSLAGAGAEVWRGIDVDTYINKERENWNY